MAGRWRVSSCSPIARRLGRRFRQPVDDVDRLPMATRVGDLASRRLADVPVRRDHDDPVSQVDAPQMERVEHCLLLLARRGIEFRRARTMAPAILSSGMAVRIPARNPIRRCGRPRGGRTVEERREVLGHPAQFDRLDADVPPERAIALCPSPFALRLDANTRRGEPAILVAMESPQDASAVSRLVVSDQAAEDARLFESKWPRISLEGLSDPLVPRPPELREGRLDAVTRARFSDTLTEVRRLMDEIEFSTGMAHLLLRDFAARNPSVSTSPNYALPEDVNALLSAYLPRISVGDLLSDLHRKIPGDRYLSRWLAGMLLDGALVKQVAVLDRMATLLELATGAPLRAGRWIAPVFSARDLDRSAGYYGEDPAWNRLHELANDEVTIWIRDEVRGGLVHRRRWPSSLAGDETLTYGYLNSEGEYVSDEHPGLTAGKHLALVEMTWNRILAPAVRGTASVLAPTDESDG